MCRHVTVETAKAISYESRRVAAGWLIAYGVFGGARRDRTDDLLRAKQALSQLSYGPEISHKQ